MTFQLLETTIWIEDPDGIPHDFYTSRDIAHEIGLLNKDGTLNPEYKGA